MASVQTNSLRSTFHQLFKAKTWGARMHPPRTDPLRHSLFPRDALGVTNNAGQSCSAAGSRPPPDRFATPQGDTQALHDGAKRHTLPKRITTMALANANTTFQVLMTCICLNLESNIIDQSDIHGS